MRNLQFGFFDDSGLPRDTRILMFYSFDTDENLSRSGILHYHVAEQRFVGPSRRRADRGGPRLPQPRRTPAARGGLTVFPAGPPRPL